MSSLEIVQLGLDELEAVRLADLEGLYQEAAAETMGISRQTFGNIIQSARKKISDALINGKALVIEGGPVTVVDRKFSCRACENLWETPHGEPRPEACPNCGSNDIHRAWPPPENQSLSSCGGWGGKRRRCGRNRFEADDK